ncbi:transposase, partial [Oligella ureolytica]
MGRYSLERKNAVINKFHSDNTLSLSELARQESIPTSTLYNWLKQVNLVGNAMSKKRNSDNWSAETKLATVIET